MNKAPSTARKRADRKQGENLREEGSRYEKIAGSYLASRGFEILEYNFRSRQSEIDLVAREGNYLVFVEVKYRGKDGCGSPFEAVDLRKQRRICRAALFYLARNHLSQDTPCRFDVVGISASEIRHIRDAFPFLF